MYKWMVKICLAVVLGVAAVTMAAQDAFPESVQDGVVIVRFADLTRPGTLRFEQMLAAFDEINQPYIVIEAQIRDQRDAAQTADRYNALALLDGFQTRDGSFRMRVTWGTRAAQLLLSNTSAVAEDVLEETLTLTPDMPVSFVSDYVRGNVFYVLADDENARRFLELAYLSLPRGKELESEALQLFVTYGIILNRFREYRQTLEVIDFAIQLDPSFAYSYFVQARALRFTGRLNQALESINRALELRDNVLYHNEKGRIYIVSEEYALAEAAYNRALEIDPNNAVALSGLGDVAYFSGDVEGSIPFFIRSAEADPTHTYALYSWAYSLYDLARLKDAQSVVLRALEVDPEYTNAVLLYADILWAQGQNTAAAEQYRLYLNLGGEMYDYITERIR
ncbi:tetratricopeptide repeat protein [Aggregatilineales bacterium SYSU G02658]